MRHGAEWFFSWSFVDRLEARSKHLISLPAQAAAIQQSSEQIPPVTLWRAFGHFCILTIAGLHPAIRGVRVSLAERVACFINPSELATIVVSELQRGHGPAYIRAVLRGRPGDLWSRLRYPLALELGRQDQDQMGRTAGLLAQALPGCGLVVAAHPDNNQWVARCALRALSGPQHGGAGRTDASPLRAMRLRAVQDHPVRAKLSELLRPWSHGPALSAS